MQYAVSTEIEIVNDWKIRLAAKEEGEKENTNNNNSNENTS